MRSVGHVVDRDASDEAVRVLGVTLETCPFATVANSSVDRTLDLGLAFEEPHQGVSEWNASNNVFEASASWRDFFGYSIDDVRKELRDVAKLAHPDDLKATRKALLNLMRGNSDRYEAQQRIRHQDGRYLPCLARAHVIERDAHGRGPALPAPIRISAA